jgi:uncharacterized protein (UPF0332 family)
VTPEAAAFLTKARQFLMKADAMLGAGWPDEAGRAAYLAGFHAAQALIFERHGAIAKTHAGVHALFAEIVRGETGLDGEIRGFLSRGYNLKALADYEADPGAAVTPARAERAILEAQRFLDALAVRLGQPAE